MKWIFKEISAFMDGGTILIEFIDEFNNPVELYLTQHAILEYYHEISKIPGNIYENDVILQKRSKREQEILEYLERNVLDLLTQEEKNLLTKKLRFIKSSEYLELEPNKLDFNSSRIVK